MNKLFSVAEGILDAQEFYAENTKDVKSVLMYASEGMGIPLTDEEGEIIRSVLLDWNNGIIVDEHGMWRNANDYYHMVVKPLMGFEHEN